MKYWKGKMSRVRFHGIDAIGRHPEVELLKSGPGWSGFRNIKQVSDNCNPDLIVWYKPFEVAGFEISGGVPRCLRYNEMWHVRATTDEILRSHTSLVICHHNNDILQYKGVKTAQFFNNPHCAEKEVFKDYSLDKEYDVLFTGAVSQHYPLRVRLAKITSEILSKKFNCKILRHPGYTIRDVDHQAAEYAKELSRARIALVSSSKHKYALAKYVEAPMCRTLLCGDIPKENEQWYKSWMLEVNSGMTNDQIANVITECLNNKKGMKELTEKGYQENLKKRTQEHYANRFVDIVKNFLKR